MSRSPGAVSDARPALQLRQRRRRRRRVRLVVVLVLVLLLAGAATWLLGWSSVLALARVEVRGTAVLTPERVADVAAAPLGRPLARVDTGAVAGRVSALAPVESVEVHRSWPTTLRIEVTERTPVLAVADPAGVALVDRAGVAFTTAASAPAGVVPAAVPAELAEDRRTELLVDLAEVVLALPPELASQVRSISTDSADTIELALTGDRVVEWGSVEDSALKARVAVVLLEQEGEVYNVSVPSHPTVR